MKPTNDVYSDDFQSMLDPYFTSGYVESDKFRYSLWDKDRARSALALTRPRKSTRHWGNATLGTRFIGQGKPSTA